MKLMKTNKEKQLLAAVSTDFAELTTQDARQILGGTNPPPAGVVTGPNGEGCTGPFRPFPLPGPTPTFPYPIVIIGPGW